jgi:uncharacterized membrane protein
MLGILFALLCATFFSLSYVLVQLGMKKSNKDNGLFINIIVNVLFLGFIYFIIFIIRKDPTVLTGVGIVAFISAGLLTSLFGRSTLFSGIRRIGSSRAVAIKNTAPIFSIIIAIAFLGESISIWSGIGMLLIILGLSLVVREQWKINGSSIREKGMIGIIFASLAALCFGTGQAARKIGILEVPDPVLGAWLGTIIALIGYCIILVFKKKFISTISGQFNDLNVYYIFAGISTTLGLILFYVAVYHTKLVYVSAIVGIEPVLTVLLAFLFLKKQEKLQRIMVISAVLVFTGIFTMSMSII